MFIKFNSIQLNLLVILLMLSAFMPISAQNLSQHPGPIAVPAPSATTPVWGKLVLKGNTVTCFYSTSTGTTTPTSWTQIGTAQTLTLVNKPFLVGLYITSHDATQLSTGTVDNFSITPSSAYKLVDCNVGAPDLMGSANFQGGVWSLMGSGNDIWNGSDQFNSQSWLVWSDCTIVCRVTSLSQGNQWQKIGIMIRDSYNSGSDYALFCATYQEGVDFQYRLVANNNPDMAMLVAPPATDSSTSMEIGYWPVNSSSYTLRK